MSIIISRRFWILLASPFFFLSWLIPVRYLPWGSAYQELFGFVAALVLLIAVAGRKIKVSKPICSIFALGLIPLFQHFFGVIFFFGDALISSVYIFSFGFMLLIGFNLGSDAGFRKFALLTFAIVFVSAAIISAWITVHQWLSLPLNHWFVPLPLGWRPYGNLSQPNNLATLLCWGLAGVIYLYGEKHFGGVVAGGLAFFLIFAVALTQSRTPWVGAVFVSLYWAWHSRYAINTYFSLRILLFWVCSYFIISFIALPWLSSFLNILSVDLATRASSFGRLEIWGQCLYAVKSGPWYGYGWTQISVAQVAVSSEYPVQIMTQYCHNVLMDIMVWNGPVIGAMIIFGLGLWFLRLNIFKGRNSDDGFCGMVMLFFLVHSALEFPHAYSFFLLPFGLFAGILEARRRPLRALVFPRFFLFLILAAGVVLSARFWIEYRIAQEEARILRFEAARIGSLQGGEKISDIDFFTQLSELLKYARAPDDGEFDVQQLSDMEKVAYRYSNYGGLRKYAVHLSVNGQFRKSCEQLLLIRDLYGSERYLSAQADAILKAHKPLPSQKYFSGTKCSKVDHEKRK